MAEREHSRMAAGSHFVSDEEERCAVATIFATLGIASRCHVITDSFLRDSPSSEWIERAAVRGPLTKFAGLSAIIRPIFNESRRSGGQICLRPLRLETCTENDEYDRVFKC